MARYSPLGNTRLFWLTSIADSGYIPTAAEIVAGTELTASTFEMNGWTTTVTRIPTPDLASTFEKQIGGSQKVDDSSLKFYLDSTTNPLRHTFTLRTEGFMVRADYNPGTVPIDQGDLVDSFPAIVIGTPKTLPVGDEAATWECQFAITAVPAVDVLVL